MTVVGHICFPAFSMVPRTAALVWAARSLLGRLSVDEAPLLIDDAGEIADALHRLKRDTLGFGNLPDRARMRATRVIPPCDPISAKLFPPRPLGARGEVRRHSRAGPQAGLSGRRLQPSRA